HSLRRPHAHQTVRHTAPQCVRSSSSAFPLFHPAQIDNLLLQFDPVPAPDFIADPLDQSDQIPRRGVALVHNEMAVDLAHDRTALTRTLQPRLINQLTGGLARRWIPEDAPRTRAHRLGTLSLLQKGLNSFTNLGGNPGLRPQSDLQTNA